MRNERGTRWARRVALGGAGLAASTLAGVLMGQTAVSQMNPIYHGTSSIERPPRSADVSLTGPSDVSYHVVPAFGYAAARPYGQPVDDAAFSDDWERTVDADYRRWQAQVAAEMRRDEVRLSRLTQTSPDDITREPDVDDPEPRLQAISANPARRLDARSMRGADQESAVDEDRSAPSTDGNRRPTANPFLASDDL